jgi:ribosome recycling factor
MAVTDQHISKAEEAFTSAVERLKDAFGKLQIGRAHASLVEDVSIEVYGSAQPLKNVATITIPEPKAISIQPWDKANLAFIEKAINASDLGLSPVNNGTAVIITLPPMTEERRQEMTKVVHRLAEEAKISIRNSRQTAHTAFKTMKNDGDATEDDVSSSEKKLQEKVDTFNKQVEELAKQKESDIMTV